MAPATRSATGALLGAVLLGALAWRPSVAIAAEVEVVTLPGATVLARVIDLDGDGVREVVRIVDGAGRGPLEVEAWRHADGSDWRASNRVALLTPLRGDVAPRPDDQQAALLPWSDGAAERLLVVAGRGNTPFGAVSDLSAWTVSLDGMRLSLEPMAGAEGPARRVDAADLDADGRDELVVTEGGTRVDPSAGLRVLWWGGDRFVAEPIGIGEGRYPTEPMIGDSDGEGGADIVIGLHTGTDLYRVTGDGSELAVEHATLGAAEVPPLAWPIVVVRRAIYLFGDSPSGPRVARLEWPRGGDPAVTATTGGRTFGWLQAMERDGSVAFVDDPGFGRVDGQERDLVVRDAGLEVVATVGPSSAASRAREWAHSAEGLVSGFFGPFPYSGPVPGGVAGSPAYVRAGQLLTFEGDDVRARPTATFVGVAPLGLAGVDRTWLVLGRGIWADGSGTYLQSMAPMDGGTWLVPADAALRPEAGDGELAVELRGAARVGDGTAAWVASPDGGFEVVVRGIPGARVGAIIGGRLIAQAEIGPGGSAVVELDPRPRREDTVEYRATIVLLEPTGHAYSTSWEGRVIREPPQVHVTGETVDGAFAARLTGQIGAGTTLTVDGEPIATDAEGRFTSVVDAGLIPREAAVRAVDPIGQEVVRRVQVVGLVDYRSWPWPVVLGALVVLVGARMYLRVPGQRARAEARDDGVIEELDAG